MRSRCVECRDRRFQCRTCYERDVAAVVRWVSTGQSQRGGEWTKRNVKHFTGPDARALAQRYRDHVVLADPTVESVSITEE